MIRARVNVNPLAAGGGTSAEVLDDRGAVIVRGDVHPSGAHKVLQSAVSA